MLNARRVRRCQTRRHLYGDIQRRIHTQPASRQLLPQGDAIDKLGDDVVRPFQLAHFVNRQNVRMVERRGRARLLLETAQRTGAVNQSRRQRLQRHFARERGIFREVHPAHSAGAQRREDPVMAHARAFRKGRRRPPLAKIARRGVQGSFNEIRAALRRLQKRLQLRPQIRVARAGGIQKGAARILLQFQRLVKKILQALPTFGAGGRGHTEYPNGWPVRGAARPSPASIHDEPSPAKSGARRRSPHR